jgi:hypothetical protein
MNKYKDSFMSASGTYIYIFLVSLLTQNGQKIFGNTSDTLGPVVFLLLFVFSALVVGYLILGKPIMLYLDNKKKEALSLFFTTVRCLGIYVILSLLALLIKI